MLCDVPAPAWYGSTTNWSRCCPPSTSSAARMIASASCGIEPAGLAMGLGGAALDDRRRHRRTPAAASARRWGSSRRRGASGCRTGRRREPASRPAGPSRCDRAWPKSKRAGGRLQTPALPGVAPSAAGAGVDRSHDTGVTDRRLVRYFSTAIAAVVASPTAVVTCRVSCTRRSPAANRPGIDVSIRSLVMTYPAGSCP